MKIERYTVILSTGGEEEFIYPCLQQLSQFARDIEKLYIQDMPDQRKIVKAIKQFGGEFESISMILPGIDPLAIPSDGHRIHMCSSDLFTYRGWSRMKNLFRVHDDIPGFFIKTKTWFWNPYFYCMVRGPLLFRKGHYPLPEDGIDMRMIPKEDEALCHNYRYIDPTVLKYLMTGFDIGEWRNCGSRWFSEIYMGFDGTLTGAEELKEKNFGTLHPWGRLMPGWRGEEFTPQMDEKPYHPQAIRQYLDLREFDTNLVRYI